MFSVRSRLSGLFHLRPCLSRLYLNGLCATLLFTSVVSAESEAREQAVLWYRSTDGCPDGVSFLASMGDRASLVRLAEAGDRVDFVVNLALTPEGAQGRLERETERGTVAIREVVDASCERVAQVVALNLSLALDPSESTPPSGEAQPAPESPAPESPEQESTGSGPEPSPAAPSDTARDSKVKAPSQNASSADENTPAQGAVTWRAGLQGGAQSGITPSLVARGVLFLEIQGWIQSLPHLTLRAAAVGMAGSSETDIGAIEQTLFAGRLEVCPVSLHRKALALTPCVTGELGRLRAAGPLSDSALWGALGAHTRGIWTFARPLSVEADVGVDVPVRKYEVVAGSTSLYRSSPVGVSALLGAAIAF